MSEPTSEGPAAGRAEGLNATVWTLATAAVLLGTLALPRRAHPARPAADREDAPHRPSPSLPAEAAGAAARGEADRGRGASSPAEIPVKGWRDILMRVYRDLGENRLLLVSAGVTYFAILAIFPAVAAIVSVYGLVADASTINDNLASLEGILPSGAIEIVGEQVKRLDAQGNTTLGFSLVLSIGLSLWSANGGVKHVFDALNIVYHERERRNVVVLNLVSLGFTAGAVLFILVALASVVAVPVALQAIGLDERAWWLALLRWPALYLLVILGLALLYRYGPSRDAPRWRWLTPGSAAAAFLWLAGSLLFSWYVAHFGSYNKTYGALGAAIGFMTWIWLSTTIVLLGAQINAETEHQTAEDTTVGPPMPLGTRDAHMADHVGAAT